MTNPITTAFHRGTKVAQKHNARDPKVVAKEKHIDPNGEHETWLHIYSKEAFKRIFDDALKEYNAKQTDSRRVIKNYFNKINKSAQHHPCYEVILTIGDKDTHPDADICKGIFKEVVDSWAERNPNLYLIGAYYHNDEPGAPHLHIDYIPIAYHNSKGMSVQCSQTKALKEMGFSNTNKKYSETELVLWTNRERNYLDGLCRQRGIEIHHPNAGKKVKHLEKNEYILTQKINELAVKKEGIEKQIVEFMKKVKEERQKAENEMKNAQAQKEITDKIRAQNEAFKEYSAAKKAEIKDEYNALRLQRDQYIEEIDLLKKEFEKIKSSDIYIKDAVVLHSAYQNLKINMEYDPEFEKFDELLKKEMDYQRESSEKHSQKSYADDKSDYRSEHKDDPFSLDHLY